MVTLVSMVSVSVNVSPHAKMGFPCASASVTASLSFANGLLFVPPFVGVLGKLDDTKIPHSSSTGSASSLGGLHVGAPPPVPVPVVVDVPEALEAPVSPPQRKRSAQSSGSVPQPVLAVITTPK